MKQYHSAGECVC